MNTRQQNSLRSYEKALGVLRRLAVDLPPEATSVVNRLDSTITEIKARSQDQYEAIRTRNVASARSHLDKMRKEHMLPLSRLALRLFKGEQNIEAALQVPHKRAPTDQIIAVAELIVKTLGPYRAVLAAEQVDPARIDRLAAEAKRMKRVLDDAYKASADRATPTRRLPALFTSAHQDILVLDALVAGGSIPIDAMHWKYARRVGKRIGRPRSRKRGTSGKRAA